MLVRHEWTSVRETGGDGRAAGGIGELWKPIAYEQEARRETGLPMTHRVAQLPRVSRRSSRLLGTMDGLVFDG